MKASRAMLGLLAAGALVLGACGDDDDDSDASAPSVTSPTSEESTPSSEASTPTSEESTPSTEESTSDEPEKFDPSLPPVVVGFANLEGGQFSIPEARIAFDAGLDYVNNELGGVNGHELRAEICNVDVTPESSINCANQFVEAGVAAYTEGYNLAVDAALPVLQEAGILLIVPNPLGPGVNAAVGDVVNLGNSTQGGQIAASLVQAKNMGGTKIAYILADVPAMHGLYDLVVPDLSQKLGMQAEVYYYQQPTDWTTFAPTALSGGADHISMFGVDADFLAAIPAFKGAGFTGVFNANTFTEAQQLDAAMLEDVMVTAPYYFETMTTGVPDIAQADIDTYLRYKEEMEGIERDAPPRQGFFIAVMVADILRQVDDPTSAAAVHEQATKASGHLFFSDGEYDCTKPTWPDTTSCATATIFSYIQPDGTLEVLPDQPVDMSVARPDS